MTLIELKHGSGGGKKEGESGWGWGLGLEFWWEGEMAAECLFPECAECGCADRSASLVEDNRSLPLPSPLLRDPEPGQAAGSSLPLPLHPLTPSFC